MFLLLNELLLTIFVHFVHVVVSVFSEALLLVYLLSRCLLVINYTWVFRLLLILPLIIYDRLFYYHLCFRFIYVNFSKHSRHIITLYSYIFNVLTQHQRNSFTHEISFAFKWIFPLLFLMEILMSSSVRLQILCTTNFLSILFGMKRQFSGARNACCFWYLTSLRLL